MRCLPGVLVEIPEAVSCSGNCRETTANETEKMGLVSERKRGINEENRGNFQKRKTPSVVNVPVRRPGGGLHIYAENVSRGIWITVNSRTTATWSSSFSSTTMRGRSARVHLDVNSLPNLRQLANAKSVRPNPESSSVFSSSKTTVPRIRNLHPPSLNNVSYALTHFGADFPIVQMNFRPCSLEKRRVL